MPSSLVQSLVSLIFNQISTDFKYSLNTFEPRSWITKSLSQEHNAVPPVSLEPTILRSQD